MPLPTKLLLCNIKSTSALQWSSWCSPKQISLMAVSKQQIWCSRVLQSVTRCLQGKLCKEPLQTLLFNLFWAGAAPAQWAAKIGPIYKINSFSCCSFQINHFSSSENADNPRVPPTIEWEPDWKWVKLKIWGHLKWCWLPVGCDPPLSVLIGLHSVALRDALHLHCYRVHHHVHHHVHHVHHTHHHVHHQQHCYRQKDRITSRRSLISPISPHHISWTVTTMVSNAQSTICWKSKLKT